MKFQIINVSPVSVSVELNNNLPYYADNFFDIYLNGELIKKEKRNVFSLFNLKPNVEYEIKIFDEIQKFKTLDVKEIINVLDRGVINDGIYNNTKELQSILDDASYKLIYFPKGKYYTSPLTFKSNTYVYFEKDAELIGSIDRNDYPIFKSLDVIDGKEIVNATWEGEAEDSYMSLISIVDAENVMIVGEGTINGNADKSDWWIDHRTMRGAWRPNNVFTNRSKNISFIGLNIINSPSWNLHPFFSDYISFIDLKLKSRYDSPNTDGCDPESCSHVDIIGVSISVGDDCVALKSGKIEMAQKFYRPCEYITIRNCYMGDGHGGVVLGSESSSGIKHVNVSKCIFENTDRGLRIKTRRGRGEKAVIEDVNFDNIYMKGVKTGFVVNMFYYLSSGKFKETDKTDQYFEKSEKTPHIGKIEFKNIVCDDIKVCAGYFYGLPESMIEQIKLNNIKVRYKKDYSERQAPAMIYQCEKLNKAGFYFYNVEDVVTINLDIQGQNGEKEVKHNFIR